MTACFNLCNMISIDEYEQFKKQILHLEGKVTASKERRLWEGASTLLRARLLAQLKPIASLSQEEHARKILTLSPNEKLDDDTITTLFSLLTRVKKLNLSNLNLTSLPFTTYLHQIEVLSLSDNPLQTISFSPPKNLKELFIINTGLQDLSPIASLTNLTKLYCALNKLTTLEALQNLDKLKLLNCRKCGLKKVEIEKFKTTHPNCKVEWKSWLI